MKRTSRTLLSFTRLEDRTLPATFFISDQSTEVFDSLGGSAENLQSEIDARNAAGVSRAFLMNAGDSLVFDLNNDLKLSPQERVLVNVTAGKAMVFLKDGFGPFGGSFDANEVSGLAVSDGFKGTVNTDVQGSIVTALDKAGVFQATALQNSSIAGLTITGRVKGSIVAGKDISNVSVGSGLFTKAPELSVQTLMTGTAATILPVDYGNTKLLPVFVQAAGTSAGNISNVKLKNGAGIVRTGDGGAVSTGSGAGGNGGNMIGVTLVDSPIAAAISAGKGGNTVSGKAGAGGSIVGLNAGMHSLATQSSNVVAGDGGVSSAGSGGAGGSISKSSITIYTDTLDVLVQAGSGGGAKGAGATSGAGGSIVNSSVIVGGSIGNLNGGFLTGGSLKVLGGLAGGAFVGASPGAGGSITNSQVLVTDESASVVQVFIKAGPGQTGGSLTGNTIVVNADVGVDMNTGHFGTLEITAGNASASTKNGGAGGSLVNDTIRFTGKVELTPGTTAVINAGRGGLVNGSDVVSGGAGGVISNLFAEFGQTLSPVQIQAGTGGNSNSTATQTKAGAGGSINRLTFNALSDMTSIELSGGAGGKSTAAGAGGAGGAVTGVTGNFQGITGGLVIRGGAGGDAPAGGLNAGSGGAVSNTTVKTGNIAGTGVFIAGGVGGASDGLGGGAGGSVSKLQATIASGKNGIFVRGGHGGAANGKLGDGGAGGSITAVNISLNGPNSGGISVDAGDGGGPGDVGHGGLGGKIDSLQARVVDASSIVLSAGTTDINRGFGGNTGGSISGVTLEVLGSVGLVAFQGGPGGSIAEGGGAAGAGGAISGVTLLNRGNITSMLAFGGGGGFYLGTGTGNAGPGGALSNMKLLSTGKINSSLLHGGDGGSADTATKGGVGGTGGAVTKLTLVDAIAGFHQVDPGDGGTGAFKGGDGGTASNLSFSGFNTTYVVTAGLGGPSPVQGGAGGSITNVKGAMHDGFFEAGDGGDGTGAGGKGGAGGGITGVTVTDAVTAVWRVMGGNGGKGTLLGGNGGSIAGVAIAGDLGGFGVNFGAGKGATNVQGGLIAGQAGAGGAAVNGSIANVTADRISSIFAGRRANNKLAAENAVFSLTKIKALVIGDDVAADGDFDFTPVGNPGFNLGDGDVLIDGIVLTRRQADIDALPVAPFHGISLIP